jgi:hypothetical protein
VLGRFSDAWRHPKTFTDQVVHELEVSARKQSFIHFVPLRPDPTGPETLDQARQVQPLTKDGNSLPEKSMTGSSPNCGHPNV